MAENFKNNKLLGLADKIISFPAFLILWLLIQLLSLIGLFFHLVLIPIFMGLFIMFVSNIFWFFNGDINIFKFIQDQFLSLVIFKVAYLLTKIDIFTLLSLFRKESLKSLKKIIEKVELESLLGFIE